jgi:outer membrane protein TolC
MPNSKLFFVLFCFVIFQGTTVTGQTLTLKEAIKKSLENYGSIKAKGNNLKASQTGLEQVNKDFLPNVVLSAQQNYGTINGQNGPMYGLGGFGVASSGLPLPEQNWSSAFGSLYLANFNWEAYTFGRKKERLTLAQAIINRDSSDVVQEQFQHQVRVASAYLNLLAAQRIVIAQQKNLDRALVFKSTAVTRASNGLIAGVDSSLAGAEVSNARISLIRARDLEQEQANRLSVLMGIPANEFVLDSAFITRIPRFIQEGGSLGQSKHPLLSFYQNRIEVNNQNIKYTERLKYPTLLVFGIIQSRGSGFKSNYAVDQTAYSHSYFDAAIPSRGNYILGAGITWNITSLTRTNTQIKSQYFISQALKDEYDLVDQQLKAQMQLSDAKIKNALSTYREVPLQLQAAQEAYQQKTALYKNGLATLVDVTQTLYALNRAETDRDIAYNNVWQALLLKAAASDDLGVFLNEL